MRTTNTHWTTALKFGADKLEVQTPLVACLTAACKVAKATSALPFDAMRFQHASAVKAGLIRNSMLESRDFERTLGALERLTLGPLARRV
jgi:hypothetical protein